MLIDNPCYLATPPVLRARVKPTLDDLDRWVLDEQVGFTARRRLDWLRYVSTKRKISPELIAGAERRLPPRGELYFDPENLVPAAPIANVTRPPNGTHKRY